MTVAQLTATLKKAKVDIPPKSRKQALIDLLLAHYNNNTNTDIDEKMTEQPKRKSAVAAIE
jgi:ribosomal protein L4